MFKQKCTLSGPNLWEKDEMDVREEIDENEKCPENFEFPLFDLQCILKNLIIHKITILLIGFSLKF